MCRPASRSSAAAVLEHRPRPAPAASPAVPGCPRHAALRGCRRVAVARPPAVDRAATPPPPPHPSSQIGCAIAILVIVNSYLWCKLAPARACQLRHPRNAALRALSHTCCYRGSRLVPLPVDRPQSLSPHHLQTPLTTMEATYLTGPTPATCVRQRPPPLARLPALPCLPCLPAPQHLSLAALLAARWHRLIPCLCSVCVCLCLCVQMQTPDSQDRWVPRRPRGAATGNRRQLREHALCPGAARRSALPSASRWPPLPCAPHASSHVPHPPACCSVNICYYSWAAAGVGLFFSLWLFFMQARWAPLPAA